jgi:hypothetical protein
MAPEGELSDGPMHAIPASKRPRGVFRSSGAAGGDRKLLQSAEVDRSRHEPGRRRSGAPAEAQVADSLTKRPMSAYFSGLRARTEYAYASEATGIATPMIPSHETGTENVPEPIVKSSLT